METGTRTEEKRRALPPRLTRKHREAWRALFEAHALILKQIDSDMEEAGVGALVDYDVMIALYEAPGRRVRLSELADNLVLSRSGVTRLVDRLEKRGYLRREVCPSDRRGAFAVLTDAGAEQMRRIWDVYATGISRHFAAHLSEAEAEQVREVFGRLVERMREQRPPALVAGDGCEEMEQQAGE